MINLIKQVDNDKVALFNHIRELDNAKDLSKKKLCIIKTNFKDLHNLKTFQQKYPQLEIWLCAEKISGKDMMIANNYGIKQVLKYPFDTKVINNFFTPKTKTQKSEEYISNPIPWMSGLKVMIVDDNPMNVELLAETLANSGLDITTFLNPIDAGIAAGKENFDLFLLDIMMPDMSGFELAQTIKESEINEDSPIMFISALSDSENKIMGYNMGSCAYIEKPFDIKVVRSQIINTLKTKQLQKAINNKKETFLATVAHDLKAPVNAEIAALELLMQNYMQSANDMEKNIVEDILGATKYMKNLLENILNKYTFENNEILLNKELNTLDSLVLESIEETKYLMYDKNIRIEFLNRAQKTSVMLDYLEIKRVIHNLFINSIEYSPQNSTLKVELYEDKNYLIFSIKNRNKGFPIENPDELFNRFVSYANRYKRVGSGLGLYIAKTIIDAHNGSIYVDTKEKDHVKFVFTLPKEIESEM